MKSAIRILLIGHEELSRVLDNPTLAGTQRVFTMMSLKEVEAAIQVLTRYEAEQAPQTQNTAEEDGFQILAVGDEEVGSIQASAQKFARLTNEEKLAKINAQISEQEKERLAQALPEGEAFVFGGASGVQALWCDDELTAGKHPSPEGPLEA